MGLRKSTLLPKQAVVRQTTLVSVPDTLSNIYCVQIYKNYLHRKKSGRLHPPIHAKAMNGVHTPLYKFHMDFWKRLKKIFSNTTSTDTSGEKVGNIKATHQLSHTPLERSEEEQSTYSEWIYSNTRYSMLDWIIDSYQKYVQRIPYKDHGLDFLMVPTLNGFVIHYDARRWESNHFVCLFDYLSTKIKELGYYCQVADTRRIRRNGAIETTQRYFLKPPRQVHPPRHSEEKFNQHYGNIMITLCLVNERIINLKFSTTHYCGRAYSTPKSFSELLHHVCNTSRK